MNNTLPRRFGIILEKILDRHERSRIVVQWNGGLLTYVIENGRRFLKYENRQYQRFQLSALDQTTRLGNFFHAQFS